MLLEQDTETTTPPTCALGVSDHFRVCSKQAPRNIIEAAVMYLK